MRRCWKRTSTPSGRSCAISSQRYGRAAVVPMASNRGKIHVYQISGSERGMHQNTAIFTIIAKNYLPYARVLMRSAAMVHPDWRRVVILVDQVDGYFDSRAEDFEVVLSIDLPIPRSRWFHFK